MRTAPGVLRQLLVDTAEGMAYVYDIGVEHRDLKSDNCLVTHDWRVKVRKGSEGGGARGEG